MAEPEHGRVPGSPADPSDVPAPANTPAPAPAPSPADDLADESAVRAARWRQPLWGDGPVDAWGTASADESTVGPELPAEPDVNPAGHPSTDSTGDSEFENRADGAASAAAPAATASDDVMESRVLRWVGTPIAPLAQERAEAETDVDAHSGSEAEAEAIAAADAVLETAPATPLQAPPRALVPPTPSAASPTGRPPAGPVPTAVPAASSAPSLAEATQSWGPRILAAALLATGLGTLLALLVLGGAIGTQASAKLSPMQEITAGQPAAIGPGRYAVLAFSSDETARACTVDAPGAASEETLFHVTIGRTQYRTLEVIRAGDPTTLIVTCGDAPSALRLTRMSVWPGVAVRLLMLAAGLALLASGAALLGALRPLRPALERLRR
ncbi:hypothetical protein Bequi_06125 [Brachybacterium sp. JHP9]|uniref:Serine/threonine protein kinase n=1 Tax=Brachybacterium equifaecis TaxID=2910770 RepID=A0ABT0QZ81_9MICO|nr:hypothetical protein [Brachybacterium equifaecis]MCL6422968.1 hypothetical protein [Brachybacterium equifaecis]